jgi:hypothetical protein
MKPFIGLAVLFFATSAFAQSAPPKAGNRPLAQVRPQVPMGCKLVGTVKGTKLWAGDCESSSALRGPAPTVDTPPPAPGAISPGQKE